MAYRDKDTLVLEQIYLSLLNEDKTTNKKNESSKLIQQAFFQKKKQSYPDNQIPKEDYAAFREASISKSKEIAEKLAEYVDASDHEILPIIAKYVVELTKDLDIDKILNNQERGLDIALHEKIRPECAIFNRLQPNTKNKLKKAIISNSEIPFTRFTEILHQFQNSDSQSQNKNSEETESKEQKLSTLDQLKDDPNLVYEDEYVYAIKALGKTIQETIDNNRKYGFFPRKCNMCISNSQMYNNKKYTLQYRFEYNLTTYFVYFKKLMDDDSSKKIQRYGQFKDRLLVEPVGNDNDSNDEPINFENLQYNINSIEGNDDTKVDKQKLLSYFPELKGAIESGTIKPIPLQGEEKEIYENVYRANSIFEIKPKMEYLLAFMMINDGLRESFNSDFLEKLKDHLKTSPNASEIYKELISTFIDMGHSMDESGLKLLSDSQRKRWSETRLRRIKQALINRD